MFSLDFVLCKMMAEYLDTLENSEKQRYLQGGNVSSRIAYDNPHKVETVEQS